MESLSFNTRDRILLIAPHPDDECIGTGGLLSVYPSIITVWVLTDGRIGQGNHSENEQVKLRKAEFEKEMYFAGISSFRYFDIPDGTLIGNTDLLLGEDLSKFSAIFVTGKDDCHADHLAAYECIRKSLLKQKLDIPIYSYEVHQPLVSPTHFIDITDRVERKRRLIAFHKSQIEIVDYAEMATYLASYRAHQYRLSGRFIEVYKKECLSELSVDDNAHTEFLREYQKYRHFYRILIRWMDIQIAYKSVSEWLLERGFLRIAVYGYAEIGKLLCREIISNKELHLLYVIDKKGSIQKDDLMDPVVPDENLEKPDLIINTADFYHAQIAKELENFGYKNIVSIYELLEGIN